MGDAQFQSQGKAAFRPALQIVHNTVHLLSLHGLQNIRQGSCAHILAAPERGQHPEAGPAYEFRLHLRGFRPDWKLIGRILAIGVPSMIMVAIGSVMYYGMNLVLMRFEHVRVGLGEVGTAVFGAYYKLQSFIFMPVE